MSEEESNCCSLVAVKIVPDWWTFVVTGVIAVILGLLAITWTPTFILSVGYLIGIMVVIYSVIAIIQGVMSKESTGARLVLIIPGILGLIVGFLVLTDLFATWLLVDYLVAIWAFMAGFTNIIMAFAGAFGKGYKILLLIAGIISVLLAIYLLVFPFIGQVVLFQVFGIFAVIWGIMHVGAGIVAKGASGNPQ
ncbi:MAG: DUF308 domain-containing protein [Methanomicrobium sp.]|nr:DUF308 domain-containing protein [Methanomicrobium sp.]